MRLPSARVPRAMQTAMLILAAAFSLPSLAYEPYWNLSDCDRNTFQKIIRPASLTNTDARAVWLNQSMLRWPGPSRSGKFKLYIDGSGRLSIEKGKKVRSQDHYQVIELTVFDAPLNETIATRFKYVGPGLNLQIKPQPQRKWSSRGLFMNNIVVVHEDNDGTVLDFTATQIAGALDSAYSSAEKETDFGLSFPNNIAQFKLWAPTARKIWVCVYDDALSKKASTQYEMEMNNETGAWLAYGSDALRGKYYLYRIENFVRNQGVIENFVTDPYSISLSADSKLSYIADLDDANLKPENWDSSAFPTKVKNQTDMVIYELHVRDFSINDDSVSKKNQGKYLAFTEFNSNGMKHLSALSKAGLSDVHLLPVFDIATIPEKNCVTPIIQGKPDSETQQAAVAASAAKDCFNWGYDPYHFNAPEGSYASDAENGATRILEFRKMVMALHQQGLRVGMDVVYNHTSTSGQNEKSVLDRIVPGYYQRLNAKGEVENSTCCDNTATENIMMGKLMRDSAVLWAKHYKIDSFRFDLMGHQPRDEMLKLQQQVNTATGRHINLIGEGWNFGEVANGARFVQASQLSLNGTGIGTFSDRARDAVRGGSPGDSGEALVKKQGYINGLGYDANDLNKNSDNNDALLNAADMIRVGLAGTIRDYQMLDRSGVKKRLEDFRYGDQAAGYVSQPGEVVNYVDNHDNQTLFDINAYKLPLNTSADDRARVQMLGIAINSFSQGIAYFHAGIETLRSKSMDGNSYDSGDWFNRLDWRFKDNYFATGLPPKRDNERNYAWIKPRLSDSRIKPTPASIAFTRDAFMDLLKIRNSSSLFRLSSNEQIKQQLKFYNVGKNQNPVVLVGHLSSLNNDKALPGAGFKELLYFINVDKKPQTLVIPEENKKAYTLHPVHRSQNAADKRPMQQAKYFSENGSFKIPPRSAVVFVVEVAL
jgi:pullulanase